MAKKWIEKNEGVKGALHYIKGTTVRITTVARFFAKPVLYEGGISRTTLSSKHVKRKRKNERGKQFNLNKNANRF